eukprot:Clim_evm29s172 gene=Clim_evmTU29s172
MTIEHLLPRFQKIICRLPAPTFDQGITTADLGKPDYELALEQHNRYVEALKADPELHVRVLPENAAFPDGHFVEDPVIVFRNMYYVCNSGAEGRRGEADALIDLLGRDLTTKAEAQEDGASLDGGDVLICSDRVLVGQSERTNAAGLAAFKAALEAELPGIKVEGVKVGGVLHLKSGITELAPGVLVRDPTFKTDYDFSSWAKVVHTLPPSEGFAADVMPVNDRLFMLQGCPALKKIALQYYKEENIVELDMSEFRKMDGALTCLSLRY